MSHQLISGYPIRRLGTTTSGFGTLAESAAIPETLEAQLCRLSQAIKDSIAVSSERYFSYHIIESHHILSVAAKRAEEDCVIHHMALTTEEVFSLQKNNTRPTPAGLIAAIDSVGLWKTGADAALCSTLVTPKLTASHIPDASTQQTWKTLTGHKGNATQLLQPPYNAKCLICTPDYFSAEQLLLLIHESTWLTSARGWGKTFRTYIGRQVDNLCKVEITRTYIGSQEIDLHRTYAADIPVLTITSDMRPRIQQLSGENSEVIPVGGHGTIPNRDAISSPYPYQQNVPEPYKYTEAPDYETFDIAEPLPPRIRWIRYIVGLFILSAIVYIIVSNYVDIASDTPCDTALAPDSEQLPLNEFASIIRRGHDADEQLIRLKSSIDPSLSIKHHILNQSIDFLVSGINKTDGHQDHLLYLLTHAGILGVTHEEVCLYYLSQAIRNYPVDEWRTYNTDAVSLKGWAKIFRDFPKTVGVITKDEQLQPYMAPILNAIKNYNY